MRVYIYAAAHDYFNKTKVNALHIHAVRAHAVGVSEPEDCRRGGFPIHIYIYYTLAWWCADGLEHANIRNVASFFFSSWCVMVWCTKGLGLVVIAMRYFVVIVITH